MEGLYILNGLNVRHNLDEGVTWYAKAALAGNRDARTQLKNAAKEGNLAAQK